MAEHGWADSVQYVYESIHTITGKDENKLENAHMSEEVLSEIFREAFYTTSDPNRAGGNVEYDPDIDRKFQREQYFDWMEFLGYEPDNFDWEAWRDSYGSSE